MNIQALIQSIRLSTTLSLMTISVLYPTFFQQYMAIPISVFLITVFGIPHGANDEWLYTRHYKSSKNLKAISLKFHATYLSIAMAWALLWMWTPIIAFWAFIFD